MSLTEATSNIKVHCLAVFAIADDAADADAAAAPVTGNISLTDWLAGWLTERASILG